MPPPASLSSPPGAIVASIPSTRCTTFCFPLESEQLHERLAEVQEEILWIAEAAHMPVIWATQVLETLTKSGQPTRAEVTDAAMGVRAECVMLNKGPHVVDAVRALDGILIRMQSHQYKKQSLMRRLLAWTD